MEFEWNISQDSPHCSSSTMSISSSTRWATPNNSKDELSSCRCSMTSYGDVKTMKRHVLQIPRSFMYLRIDFQQDSGHSSDQDQNQNGILLMKANLKENGTESFELMMIKFRKSEHPFFRATSPLSRGTLKGGRKLSFHFCADGDTIETVFRTLISQSAQYLRSSLRCVGGIQCLSNKNGETRVGRTV